MSDVPAAIGRLEARQAAHEVDDERRHNELRAEIQTWREEGNQSRQQVYGLLQSEIEDRRKRDEAEAEARRKRAEDLAQQDRDDRAAARIWRTRAGYVALVLGVVLVGAAIGRTWALGEVASVVTGAAP